MFECLYLYRVMKLIKENGSHYKKKLLVILKLQKIEGKILNNIDFFTFQY